MKKGNESHTSNQTSHSVELVDMGKENGSASLHRERSADCLASDTNLIKLHIASNLPRRSCSLRRHSQMPPVHWLTNGSDQPYLVPCEYVRFVS